MDADERITARPALESDVPALKALWKEAFGDEDEYIDYFFSKMFSPANMVVLERGKETASMAALLPCTLVLGAGHCGTARYQISYLYAMATSKALRGRGLGLELLHFAAEHCRERGDSGIALLPADEGLHYFYSLAGYKEAFTLIPRQDNYIEYGTEYLDFCASLGYEPADNDELRGVFLALAPVPAFTAYMAYPLD